MSLKYDKCPICSKPFEDCGHSVTQADDRIAERTRQNINDLRLLKQLMDGGVIESRIREIVREELAQHHRKLSGNTGPA